MNRRNTTAKRRMDLPLGQVVGSLNYYCERMCVHLYTNNEAQRWFGFWFKQSAFEQGLTIRQSRTAQFLLPTRAQPGNVGETFPEQEALVTVQAKRAGVSTAAARVHHREV